MHPWDDPRRYQAAIHEQVRINDEMAERDRAELKKAGSGFGFAVFMVIVIFFKPLAEYCIELYDTIAGYVSSLGTLVGL